MTFRLFFSIAALVFVLLRLPSLFEPYWYGDEAIYLTLGWLQRLGYVVYRDFYDHKPPLILVLSAFLPALIWAKMLISVLTAFTSVFFYYLSSKFLNLTASRLATLLFIVLASIPLFEGNIFNSEIINLFLVTLSFYLSLVKKRHSWSFFILGVAFTNKFPALFDYLFLMAYLVANFSNLRRLGYVLKSGFLFSLPTLVFSFYFLLNQSLSQFIKAAFLDNLIYISSWESPGPGLFGRTLFFIFLISLLVVLARRSRSQTRPLFWLSGWFISVLFASLLSSRPYPHYLLQIVPPLAMIIPLLFTTKRQLLAIPSTALVLTILVFHLYGFYRYPVVAYYRTFYSSLMAFDLSRFSTFFGPHVEQISSLSSSLKAAFKPGSRLFLWGDWPQVYHLSGLVPALPYITSFHLTALNQEKQMMQLLSSRPPSVIVLLKPPPPPLYQLIKKLYRQDMALDYYTVYRLL